MTKIKDIGEFGLIRRLAGRIISNDPRVHKGLGDDTAVFSVSEDHKVLATCDAMVEGLHFILEHTRPFFLGRKAAAVNISDIAAMGGSPTFMLVSLGLPPDTEAELIEEIYDGIVYENRRHEVVLVGGNVTHMPERLVIDVTLLGDVFGIHPLYREGAQPGDTVCVTGTLGDSAAGLHLMLNPDVTVSKDDRDVLLRAHQVPTPRVAEGQALAASGRVTACIDISDGTLADLSHILEASGVGARVRAEALPISDFARRAAQAAGIHPGAWALKGGEDYELLFTLPPESVATVREALGRACGTPVTVIGEITENADEFVVEGAEDLPGRGWDHFAPDA